MPNIPFLFHLLRKINSKEKMKKSFFKSSQYPNPKIQGTAQFDVAAIGIMYIYLIDSFGSYVCFQIKGGAISGSSVAHFKEEK